MYALLGLLLIAATWCFVLGWRTRRLGYWIAFGVLAGLAMYAQQLAAFYLVALGVVPLLAPPNPQPLSRATLRVAMQPEGKGSQIHSFGKQRFVQSNIGGLVLGVSIPLIIYLPWMVNLPAQFGKLG